MELKFNVRKTLKKNSSRKSLLKVFSCTRAKNYSSDATGKWNVLIVVTIVTENVNAPVKSHITAVEFLDFLTASYPP